MPTLSSLAQVQMAPAAPGWKAMLVSLGPFILVIVVMYYLIFRSQAKQAKRRKEMLGGLKAGDKIFTTGGIYGTIEKVKERSYLVSIARNVTIEVSRNGIAGLVNEKGDEVSAAD